MGWFTKKSKETKTEEAEVVEESEMEEDTYNCDDCGEEFKESMLNDDSVCKVCEKKRIEAKKRKNEFNHTFTVLFEVDEDGNQEDDLEINGLTEIDAKAVYNNIKTALKNKEDYFEIPEMQQYDFDNERIKTFYPEFMHIINVRKAYYEKDNNDEE